MGNEPSDELIGIQRRCLYLIGVAVVSPEKEHFPVLNVVDTVIADGDPVGICSGTEKSPEAINRGFEVGPSFLMIDPQFIAKLFSPVDSLKKMRRLLDS